MNASRAVLMVVGANLIAVWAVAAVGGRMAVPDPGPSPGMTAEQAVEEASTSLLAAVKRLEAPARRHSAAALARDPFRFGAASRPAARRAPELPSPAPAAGDAAAAASAVEPEPDIVLQGMAESAEGDTTVRTAILRAGNELVLAALGARVGSRYEVVALTSDSVELEDAAAHVRRTYRMK
jgi:hypothetical protein